MIAIRSLTKRYGSRQVLDRIGFTAADGSITALLGPNGAGKSTTFRIASGLLRADSGSVEIDGSVGVLPHAHGLYGRLTVREHITYFGALRGVRPSHLQGRVDALLGDFGLSAEASQPVRVLSQGQRVRVALASALVHGPRNLILDEPTSGLDVMSVRALHALLRGLRDNGACVLFSSHVMHEVASLCDSVVMLSHGRVAAAGTPASLLASHAAGSLEDVFVSLAGNQESEVRA